MSLDKWIKNDENNKKVKKKLPPKKEKVEETIEEFEFQPPEVGSIKDSRLLTKFALTCSDSKCKYKKTLKKKTLKDKDKICPRCKGEMKIKIFDN
ncbi:MAG: hypothetical protein KGD66_03090 [Candidatus Lokiarchaeota archaeon]|nr:hypothetical protein [Candidatus Lokiarchaeota archaeon]